jgi:hypothetical protein
MRHDPGLAASPPVRYILKMERCVLSLFFAQAWTGIANATCPPGKASQAGTQRSQTYETVTLTPASRSQFPVVAVACTTALAFGA